MTLIDHPSPNHSPRRKGVRVDTIVIHHTATSSDENGTRSAVGWLSQKASKASSHYVIGHDGKVYRLVQGDRTAWHAGLGRLPWEKGPFTVGTRTFDPVYDFNHRSIGVELVNPGDGKTPFTEAQYAALGELLPDILSHLSCTHIRDRDNALIGRTTSPLRWVRDVYLLGHRDVAPGRKTDPADNFDWDRVRTLLSGRVA